MSQPTAMTQRPDSLPRPADASTCVLPPGPWSHLLDGLCARFPAVPKAIWLQRLAQGRVLDPQLQPLAADSPYRHGMQIYYFREVANERPIPFCEQILYQNDHLLVADKPPFLPVIPSGGYVEQTLLRRLSRRLGNADLQPLHRLDRHTRGLVLFSVNRTTRGRYQALFRDQKIHKLYEAIAPALPQLVFPHVRESRIERDERFFRSREVAGPSNAQTRIALIERQGDRCRYRLEPVTGKKHQLRLHLAALGAPIENDAFYPEVDDALAEDFTRPLQLLAREVRFVDPVTGIPHHFCTQQALAW